MSAGKRECPVCGVPWVECAHDSMHIYAAALKYRYTLKKILEWDCLNPPQTHDLDWLRLYIEETLRP